MIVPDPVPGLADAPRFSVGINPDPGMDWRLGVDSPDLFLLFRLALDLPPTVLTSRSRLPSCANPVLGEEPCRLTFFTGDGAWRANGADDPSGFRAVAGFARNAMTQKTTFSACYMCTQNCPITVVSDGDVIVSIEHPDCVRATAMQEQRESEHRLTSPRIRSRADEAWRDASWEEALSATSGKMLEIRERHGAESVAFAVGYTKEVRPYLQRLAHAFGSPHYVTESSCCFSSGYMAASVTLGKEYGYFLGPGRMRFPETRCRLVWSNNPSASQLPFDRHHLIVEAPEVPTIVVDPRRTPLTGVANIHLMLRPGTDGALALGLAHVILEEGLQDQDFLDDYAHGLEAYREYVKTFSPETTSQITGVPAEKIVVAAKLYATSHPAQITISPNATTHHSNGFQNHRAILLLSALCGNLDVAGGNRPWGHRLQETSVDLTADRLAHLAEPLGGSEHPLFVQEYREAQGMHLADAIESGRVKAVFSVGLNSMMWPNSKRLDEALRSLELFTACDFFPNPTVDAATVFFPAATHLERQALIVWGSGRLQYRPAAVAPRGQARGDTELVFDLAESLGLKEQFWNGDLPHSYSDRLESAGLSFDDLPKDGRQLSVEVAGFEKRGYAKRGFGTPTGKVEFVSTTLERAGYDGLPVYREPFWSPISTPNKARDYPLVLTSGGRSDNFTHSQGRELETLRQREREPRLQISPVDAEARGIRNDDWIETSSPIGSITLKAWVTESVPAGMVHAFHGWAEANVNELIPDEGLDPISGFPPFKSSLCQVRKRG
jgi:anaerobic selenocysteine-containing dehydrogenase